MPIRERPGDRGDRRGRYLTQRIAREMAEARRASSLSQRELGRVVGVSHNRIGRVERGDARGLTVDLAARMASALGLQLSVTLHPDGDPVRDQAHLALLERLHARLPARLRWRTEVPIPIQGDRRSADAVIDTGGGDPAAGSWEAMVEAETRLEDVQALERKIGGKQRDLGVARVILLVADTRHNRAVIARVPELRRRFPIGTRAALHDLRQGCDPGGDCLIVL